MKERVIEKLKNETVDMLCKRGRNVELEQLCIWAGISEYGTAKNKAERLLAWSAKQ